MATLDALVKEIESTLAGCWAKAFRSTIAGRQAARALVQALADASEVAIGSLSVGGGTNIGKIIVAQVTPTMTNVPAGGSKATDVTVSGASTSMYTQATLQSGEQANCILAMAYVLSADTVRITWQNDSGADFTPSAKVVNLLLTEP